MDKMTILGYNGKFLLCPKKENSALFGPKKNMFGFFSKICSLGFYGITLDDRQFILCSKCGKWTKY